MKSSASNGDMFHVMSVIILRYSEYNLLMLVITYLCVLASPAKNNIPERPGFYGWYNLSCRNCRFSITASTKDLPLY